MIRKLLSKQFSRLEYCQVESVYYHMSSIWFVAQMRNWKISQPDYNLLEQGFDSIEGCFICMSTDCIFMEEGKLLEYSTYMVK